MGKYDFDIIVIGAGSGGLMVGLFMNQAGFNVLMVSKSGRDIGGDCLNDGCVPSKALIHAAKLVSRTRDAENFGLHLTGDPDIKKIRAYIIQRQEIIRAHENEQWLNDQGIAVALGDAQFSGQNEVTVGSKRYSGQNIVIATGSRPSRLQAEGVDKVRYYDNESIFHLEVLPKKILFVGGGPIGIEIAQALRRLGSDVTLIHKGAEILPLDDPSVSEILRGRLEKEGIEFHLNAQVMKFTSATEAIIEHRGGSKTKFTFDAVFVAVGRELDLEALALNNAGIRVVSGKIVVDPYLRTSNKRVFVCGDIAGDLQFSHAAEFHGRTILNNLFSPFKKKLKNDHMSWVTFTDPELATFGLTETELKKRKIGFRKLVKDFTGDDRAVVDNYQYGKLILFVSKKSLFGKRKLLGGTMVAPNAGELIQELILVNNSRLSLNEIFNKIYPYPVASRINQSIVTDLMSESLTSFIKKLLQKTYRIFG